MGEPIYKLFDLKKKKKNWWEAAEANTSSIMHSHGMIWARRGRNGAGADVLIQKKSSWSSEKLKGLKLAYLVILYTEKYPFSKLFFSTLPPCLPFQIPTTEVLILMNKSQLLVRLESQYQPT